MLKKINVPQLKLGMHIEKFESGWLSNPFWRSSFLLKKKDDLDIALASGIHHVWIDTSKGLDVDDLGDQGVTNNQPEIEGVKQLAFVGGEDEDLIAQEVQKASELTRSKDEGIEDEIGPRFDTPSPFAEEMERAGKIVHRANLAVRRMFADAKDGKPINIREARPIVQAISSSIKRHPDAIVAIARHKDKGDYATMHSVAVCALMSSLCVKMGKDGEQTELLGMAGLLMDLGVALLPINILGKPGPLNDHEIERVKLHTVDGVQLLKKTKDVPKEVFQACLCHHERYDGGGYPKALVNMQIPEVARMAALCDVYDAMTSDRPHRSGMSPSEALKEIARQKEKFDPLILQAFVKALGIYPVGSLVRLQSDQLAVVVEQGNGSLLHPVVKVFYSIKNKERINPSRLELGPLGDKIVSKEDPTQYDFGSLDAFWRFD